MILDASPYGLGGVLLACDHVVSWFSSDLTHHDEVQFHHRAGSDTGQQTWEALCILVALRTWAKQWMDKQITLTIKSDNISALVMTSRLRITASRLVAKELAMTLSEASFMPRHVVHVPGAMNCWADALSRLSAPGGKYSIPPLLREAPRAFPAERSPAYYTTLDA